MSTPAVSLLIRAQPKGENFGAFIFTASHNPGGPDNDLGFKFNGPNGAAIPEQMNNRVFEETKKISEYKIADYTGDISFIQPSEFEGDCSGQIIDAITIGQRVIASDLDVIKEVSFYESIKFFKLNDVSELSDRMIDYIKTPFKRPSFDELIQKEEAYRKKFSDAVYTIIDSLKE